MSTTDCGALSNTPPLSFKADRIIKAMLILIVMIGLSLSFIANKFFSADKLKKKINETRNQKEVQEI